MNFTNIEEIAEYIVSDGKGILAADESNPTCGKRFESIGVESSEESRRDYREMLFSSEGIKGNIGGVILFDETLRQSSIDGTPLIEIIEEQGAVPGIKVDKGLEIINEQDETVTRGLEGLNDRCSEYYSMGARFTKWRAVIKIGDQIPSDDCINQNMEALAEYALIAQNNKMVPIVEPEVLMEGPHSIDDCYDASSRSLKALFESLISKGVNIKGTILKPSMITSGSEVTNKASISEVAEITLKCLKDNIPDELPGIAFLSGGQSDIDATAHLDAMNKIGGFRWSLSFSYGRALQQPALKSWLGLKENLPKAQAALSHRALMNRMAAEGKWEESLETIN
ncbi:MAG: class I fructose-bisphosphate aldolase [Gammaproteobacteria bacterium]